jgi:hypothetical protein
MSESSTTTQTLTTPPPANKPQLTMGQVLEKAAASAAKGGIAGACAMGANVAALMWIRTAVRAQLQYTHMYMHAS